MSARIQWWGRSEGQPEGYGFLLQRARSLACSPHDLPLGRATREERLRALVRAEARCQGERQIARLMILPSALVAAVDDQPHVPPSGLHVHRIGADARGLPIPWPKAIRDQVRAEVLEARAFREKTWDAMSEDERVIADELRRDLLGQWGAVFR